MARSMAAALDGWGDLTGQKKKNADHNARESQLDREEEERGFTRRPSQASRRQAMPGFAVPIFGPAEQRQIANDMSRQTMAAFDKENYSRVAQGREMRRMAHEQELARINAQAGMFNAAADRDAALIRALLAD